MHVIPRATHICVFPGAESYNCTSAYATSVEFLGSLKVRSFDECRAYCNSWVNCGAFEYGFGECWIVHTGVKAKLTKHSACVSCVCVECEGAAARKRLQESWYAAYIHAFAHRDGQTQIKTHFFPFLLG